MKCECPVHGDAGPLIAYLALCPRPQPRLQAHPPLCPPACTLRLSYRHVAYKVAVELVKKGQPVDAVQQQRLCLACVRFS
ncbi:hypothetical protein E2C01_047130 [Portunus trituberculatus]|uniref:Uncharacterized protein n=1 Tax=Portunus trituberculatus TaxID=210409 RepID=A0A5B7G0B4_PORTR|nr:hypothetical protein [Portunus trituberculatus]